MKIICNNHLKCKIDCPHKKLHNHMEFCDRDCENVHNSKCDPTLSQMRQEKLKKINAS